MPELTATQPESATAARHREPHSAVDLPAATGADLSSTRFARCCRICSSWESAISICRRCFARAPKAATATTSSTTARSTRRSATLPSFERLAEAAREAGMGILLDVVPNHMGINDPGNVWWLDVLENGEGSYFADFFDIDWHPPPAGLQDKILLPFLGEPFGRVLENGELQVVYDERRCNCVLRTRRFPLAPPSWPAVLELGAQRSGDVGDRSASGRAPIGASCKASSRNCATCRRHATRRRGDGRTLPRAKNRCGSARPAVATIRRRARGARRGDSADQRRRRQSEELRPARTAARPAMVSAGLLARRGGRNQLPPLLRHQRPGGDPRRRTRACSMPSIAWSASLLEAGWVTGLRIDHPDGLRDPQNYFKNLASALPLASQPANDDERREIYVVAEKILSRRRAAADRLGRLRHDRLRLDEPHQPRASRRRRPRRAAAVLRTASRAIDESRPTSSTKASATVLLSTHGERAANAGRAALSHRPAASRVARFYAARCCSGRCAK